MVGRPSNAAARRKQILAGAAEIFSRRGYRGTSMNEIATVAGLSKPTLYHYFQNKEEILVHLYEDVMSASVSQAESIVTDSGDPTTMLRALIVQRVAATCQAREIYKVFFEEEGELPRKMVKRLLEQRHRYEDIMKDVLRRLLDETGRSDAVDITVFVNTCLGAANWVYKWYDPDGGLMPFELGARMADYMLAGVTTNPVDSRQSDAGRH